MKNLLLELTTIPLSNEESILIDNFTNKAVEKYPNVLNSPDKVEGLRTLYSNIFKHYKLLKESAAIKSSDIDVFRDIAVIATTRAYVGNILEYIASIQPIENPYQKVFFIDQEYGDDYAPENITAGTSFKDKRSKKYASDRAEGQPARRIKATIKSEFVNAQVRPIELSYTLEAMLSLSSVFGGQENARKFLDQRYLQAISNKLRDEMELLILEAIDNAVYPENIFTVSKDMLDGTDCKDERCAAQRLYDAIDDAAYAILGKTGVRPNVVIVGNEAMKILRKADKNMIRYADNAAPTSIARNYFGVLDNKYNLLYDPTIKGITLLFRELNDPSAAAVVYAPHIPLGVTNPVTERTLETYRVVYTVDAYKVVHPEVIAKVLIA